MQSGGKYVYAAVINIELALDHVQRFRGKWFRDFGARRENRRVKFLHQPEMVHLELCHDPAAIVGVGRADVFKLLLKGHRADEQRDACHKH